MDPVTWQEEKDRYEKAVKDSDEERGQ